MMTNEELVKGFAIATVILLGLLLGASTALASVPRANCGPNDWTESGLQGQTTPWERDSGDSLGGYNCNLELVGQWQGEGAFSQLGPAYAGDCAYYGMDFILSGPYGAPGTALQQHHGVVVVDASD